MIAAFLVSPLLQRHSFGAVRQHSFTAIAPKTPRHISRLSMSVTDSTDPFQVLNLSPTSDRKEIKRAYKRMALKYHPDVVTNQDSTPEMRKKANDEFAKINWAYAQLSGKNGATSSTSSSASTSSSYSYTPPHRRTSSTYNPNQASTDWRDYMPKYDEEAYNAGGDSFEKILSDLFVGAAGVAGSGGGIFRDFVEFLESNVEGYSAGEEDDAQLRILLTTGSVEEVGMEMDDTELVVQQLDSKRTNLADELIMRQADRKIASGYMEKMELDEKVAELEARKQVVDEYIKKARKRLLSLQMRYKQLVVGGENDNFARGRSSSNSGASWDRQTQSYSPGATSSKETSSNDSMASSSREEDAWKHEGFGSSGRGRGSSRQSRGRDTRRSTVGSQRQSSTSSTQSPPPQQASTSRAQWSSSTFSTPPPQTSTSSARSSSVTPSQPWTPPHRRMAYTETQAREDKKRLQELEVDDAFDQLKKDLGL
jgi:hypothetical protein